MTLEEKLEQAELSKQEGTNFFLKNEFELALQQYQKIISYLQYECKAEGENKTRKDRLLCAGHLNLAACYLKLERFEAVIEHSKKALEIEPENPKGHFRRGKAYIALQEFEKAKENFMHVLVYDPSNSAAKKMITLCDANLKKQLEKEKKMYQNIFKKLAEEREKVDTTMISQADSSVYLNDSDFNQVSSENVQQITDIPMDLDDPDVDDPDVDQSLNDTECLPDFLKVVDPFQGAFPRFQGVSSPDHKTDYNATMIRNIDQMVETITHAHRAGTLQDLSYGDDIPACMDGPYSVSEDPDFEDICVPFEICNEISLEEKKALYIQYSKGSLTKCLVNQATTKQEIPLRDSEQLIDSIRQAPSSEWYRDSPTMTRQAGPSKPTQACSKHLVNQATKKQDIPLNNPFYKTKLCRRFLSGHCDLGVDCLDAHERDDLQQVDKKTISSDLGSDGEVSPRSDSSSSSSNGKPLDFDAFMKKRY